MRNENEMVNIPEILDMGNEISIDTKEYNEIPNEIFPSSEATYYPPNDENIELAYRKRRTRRASKATSLSIVTMGVTAIVTAIILLVYRRFQSKPKITDFSYTVDIINQKIDYSFTLRNDYDLELYIALESDGILYSIEKITNSDSYSGYFIDVDLNKDYIFVLYEDVMDKTKIYYLKEEIVIG